MVKCDFGSISRNCTVYVSKFKGIYENLALEEWLFRNHDIQKDGQLLLVWSNTSAVVIGRHQNPFLEAHCEYLKDKNVDLARRHSGGGTVFHGLGNLNLSILTTQKDHCRPRNLQWVANTLNNALGSQLLATSRDDLIFPDERKVSGTAARIAKNRAYHHLTLLIDEDLTLLRSSLDSPYVDLIETNATRSVRAKHVGQLSQDVSGITVDQVKDLLVDNFVEQFEDSKVISTKYVDGISFPGINSQLSELLSWEWIFGKTPKFIFNEKIKVERGKIIESADPKFIIGQKFSPF